MARSLIKTATRRLSNSADDAVKLGRQAGKQASNATPKVIDLSPNNYKVKNPSHNDLIDHLQNQVDSGVDLSSAVSQYLDDREIQKKAFDRSVAERRARQQQANQKYQSAGSGNRASRKADEARLANEIANGREAASSRNAIIQERRARQQQAFQEYESQGSGNRAFKRADDIELVNAMADGRIAAREASMNKEIGTDRAIRERRARQEKANLEYQSQGSGSKAERRAREIAIARGRNTTPYEISNNPSLFGRDNARPNLINQDNSVFNEISDKQFNRMDKKAARAEKRYGIEHSKPRPMNKNKLSKAEQEKLKEASRQRLAERGISPSGGNNSATKHLADRVKGNNFVYNMTALGVGGGLVLNMANNKGQQTNAQLYGQY